VFTKVLAVCVALLLLGGAVQAADFHVASTATVELDTPAIDLVVAPVEPVATVVPPCPAVVVVTPPPLAPITSVFAPSMDRPPRP